MEKYLQRIEALLVMLAGQQAMPDDSWQVEWNSIKQTITEDEHNADLQWQDENDMQWMADHKEDV